MKALKKSVILYLILASLQVFAQVDVRPDNYVLRSDVGLDYKLFVRNNDTPYSQVKIYDAIKIGASASLYTISVIDSDYIVIRSTSADTFNGRFSYKGRNSTGSIDSTEVSFIRTMIPASVRPGETNLDGLVNHFDIFQIGINYGRRGDGRHALDTNINFGIPKRMADWTFGVNNVNAKHADVDGNGVLDMKDFKGLEENIGSSLGSYTPLLSPASTVNKITLAIPDSLVLASKDSNKITIPVQLTYSGPSYGLGFSYTIRNQIEGTTNDTFYNKSKYIRPQTGSPWVNTKASDVLFLEDKRTRAEHTNLAFARTLGTNGNSDSDLGIIEVITEEIVWGKVDKNSYSRLFVSIKDISFIDNSYNLIPIQPVEKYVYFKAATASISKNSNVSLSVFPTMVDNYVIVENQDSHPIQISIYNCLGQLIHEQNCEDGSNKIETSLWSKGVYYIIVNKTNQVFKLVK